MWVLPDLENMENTKSTQNFLIRFFFCIFMHHEKLEDVVLNVTKHFIWIRFRHLAEAKRKKAKWKIRLLPQ